MKNLIFIFLLFSFIACRPFTKESYLKDYDTFITKIADEEPSYTESDWESTEKKFQKFNTDWYDHFSNDLTFAEKLTVTKLHTQYIYYKGKSELRGVFKK